MKRIKVFMIFSAIMAAALFSCSKDSEQFETDGSGTEVKFKAGLATRAHDGQWDSADAIGITMLNRNTEQIIGSYYNYEYVTGEPAGDFTPANNSKRVFFPQDGMEVTFRSYYPYNPAIGADMLAPVSVKDQDDLPAIDFMTAEHTKGFSKLDKLVELDFYHRLSGVIFNISFEEGQPVLPLETITLTIKGMYTKGTYDVMNGELSVNGTSMTDITVPYRGVSNDPNNRQAIVMPRAGGEGVVFEFTDGNGGKFIAKMDDTQELSEGYRYIFNIKLSQTPIVVSAKVVEWEKAEPVDLTAIMVGAVFEAGESNVEEGTEVMVYTGNQTAREELALFKFEGGQWKAYDPADPDTPKNIYWEDITDDPATFYASIFIHDKYNATQADDYFTASPVTVSKGQAVNFTLSHPAAQVVVQLSSSDDSFSDDELPDMTVTLPGYITGGYYDSGLYMAGSTVSDVNIAVTTDTDGKPHALGVIDPQKKAAGVMVNLASNGKEYTASYPAMIDFKAGYTTVLRIDLKKTGLSMSAKVVDWEQGPTYAFTASGILVEGELGGNSDFFYGKTIYVYRLNDTSDPNAYTCAADGSSWTGPAS